MKTICSLIHPYFIILFGVVIIALSSGHLRLHAQQPEWTIVAQDSLCNLFSLSCADGDNCFVVGANGNDISRIYQSTNSGFTWNVAFQDTFSFTPLYFPEILQCVSYPTKNFAIAASDSGGFTRTTDGGQTWKQYRIEEPQWKNKKPIKIAMCDVNNGIMTVADNLLRKDRLYHTTDGGLHWDSLPIPAPPAAFSDIVCFSPRSFGCFLYQGKPFYKNYFARSDDTGKTWELTPQAIPVDTTLFYPQMCFIDSLRGWMSMGLKYEYTRDSLYYVGKRCLVFHTTDGGRHWQKQLDTMQQPPYLTYMNHGLESISFADSLNGLTVGEFTVFRTTNGGNTWTFERVDTTWLHGTHHLSYREKGKGVIVTLYRYFFVPASRASVPDGAALPDPPNPISVFPNPAPHGQRCRVRFSLQQQAHVRISVCDVTGCTVRALPDQIFEAGPHTQEFSIEGLPPGQYFGRVVIGTQIYVQPMRVQ